MKHLKKYTKKINKGEYWSCNVEENTMRKQLQKIGFHDDMVEQIIDKAKEYELVGVINNIPVERAFRIYVSKKGLEYDVHGFFPLELKHKYKNNGHIKLNDEEMEEVTMIINTNKFNI